MKKISLILLLITAVFNTSAPMANSKTAAKGNPAIAIATAKLQAKPILFFDTTNMHSNFDYQSGEIILIKKSKSNEMHDMSKEQAEWGLKWQKVQEESQSLYDKYCKGSISQDVYQKAIQQCEDIQNQLGKESMLGATELEERQMAINKRIAKIKYDIAKRLNASAVLNYNENNSETVVVDFAYDITQEVFDTLNQEYQDSQSEKHTCNHCCDVHCPHNY